MKLFVGIRKNRKNVSFVRNILDFQIFPPCLLASHPSRPGHSNGGPLCWLPWLGSPPPSTPSFTLNVSSFAIFFYYLKVCSSASRTFNLDIIFLFFPFLSFISLFFFFLFFSFFFFFFLFFSFFFFFLLTYFFFCLSDVPSHLLPFILHRNFTTPLVLMQAALSWHPPLLIRHTLISVQPSGPGPSPS